ncbi:MAG: ribonuclease H-like YkuK family protein [Dehalococcoidia bacterium]
MNTVPKLDLDYEVIKQFIRNSHAESVVMIGCDSVRKASGTKATALYSTVVVVRKSSGHGVFHGCKIFGTSVRLPDYGKVIRSGKLANLKLRLLQEVTFALEAFDGVQEAIGDRPFEIHLDIASDPRWESNVAMNDAKGYVLGVTGREPNFKPTALAASFAADAVAHGMEVDTGRMTAH